MRTGKKTSLTIKNEVFLLSFFFLLTIAVIFTGVMMCVLYSANMKSARNSLRECNRQIVGYVEGMFHENAAIVRILSRDITVINAGNGDSAKVLSIYDAILNENENITYLYSGYENGELYIANYETSLNFSLFERPWYQAAIKSDDVVQLAYLDVITGEWLISQSKRLLDEDGNIVGAVAVDCANMTISCQLSTKYQYESQRSFIMNGEGRVIIHPEDQYINEMMTTYMDANAWRAIEADQSNYEEYRINGMKTMAYFEKIPETDLIVVTSIDASEVTVPIWKSMLYLLALMAFLSILFGFVLSRTLMYRFASPLIALRKRIEKVARGEQADTQSLTYSNAEINDIANSIEIIVKDIARREEERKSAEYLSFHDSLTGLYNRRYFSEKQNQMDTEQNYPLSVICCDINGLKMVNDVFGHEAGDKLICMIADCLRQSCREKDIAARVGGDEFSVLMPDTSEEEAKRMMERITKSFPAKGIYGAVVSASLGYSVKVKSSQSIEETIRLADKMMYDHKRAESRQMKEKTLANIMAVAREEKLVREPGCEEERILDCIARTLCKEEEQLFKQCYMLRNIGMSRVFQSEDANRVEILSSHTENGYRLLSTIEKYKAAANYVLHYTEHWDGSGRPAGLEGEDIPYLSRVLAAADTYLSAADKSEAFKKNAAWYDPAIVKALSRISP